MKINSIKYLYHGTNQEFEAFDFGKAKAFKDFGKGFYLTTNLAQAQKWAQNKGRRENKAYIYRYVVTPVVPDEWKILELLQYDKKWVDFITQCRIEGVETDYDIIYDRMADSHAIDISESLRDYNEDKITADEVISKIKWKDSTKADQFCFKNKRAVQLLKDREVFVWIKDSEGRWKFEERKR